MTNRFTLFWIRYDEQGDYDMGSFATEADAIAAQPKAMQKLLGQQGDKGGLAQIRHGIRHGWWDVIEEYKP